MTRLIEADTLDDALCALAALVGENEARKEATLVFCEDRLTLLAEKAILRERGGTFLTEVTTFRRVLGKGEMLSKQGSVLELSALLEQYEGELKCFKKSAAQAVYETIAQLSASCVDGELLSSCMGEADDMLAKKLSDLSFLLTKYNEFLHENHLLDENGYLALLPSRLRESGLEETNVVFFAFPSFTRQAREVLRTAMQCARRTAGIFLGGTGELYTNEASEAFARVSEEFGGAKRERAKSTLEGEAKLVYESLYRISQKSGDEKKEATHVWKLTAGDEAEEMEKVAALIKKHVAEGRRYRDISVLVGGPEYLLPAIKAFEAFHIPCDADVKRPFSRHPFCRFVFDVLAAVADGVLPEEADAVLSSFYFGESGQYRNYLLKFGGWRGAVRRAIREGDAVKEYDREALVVCREKLLSILDLFKSTDTGAAYADAIWKLYDLVDGERVGEELQRRLPPDEAAFLDLSRLRIALDEAKRVVGERKFSARAFLGILKNGLEALTVSIIPPHADAVFVGDVTDSKICRADILFCVGLTDALPVVSQDTAIVSDAEIERLSKLQVEIEPAIAAVNRRAREAFALNLCAFREALYLSCPARKGGAEAAESEIFTYLGRAMKFQKEPEIFPYDCAELPPAVLAYYRSLEEQGEMESEEVRRRGCILEALKRWGVDVAQGPKTREFSEAGRLYFRREISPTLLEDYFACPYKAFAMRALRMREREERTPLDAADAGTFVHAVLEKVAANFNEITSVEACREAASALARELLSSPRFSALGETKAGAYTAERLVKEAETVTAAAYLQLIRSNYRVDGAEQIVEYKDLKLKGKVDRIDRAGDCVRVIDYKTGSFDDKPAAYYTGRKLQLELYLLASSEGGIPAGAFYFPAADEFMKTDEGKFRMRGFYCNDEEIVRNLDPAYDGKKSDFFEGGRSGKGMAGDVFADFLTYGRLVSEKAEEEMRAGNIAPSPYEGTCAYCKLKGACGFVGNARSEGSLSCADIAEIAHNAKEDEDV